VVAGLGCGLVKLYMLQKRWFVCRLAALLILQSVGILSAVFLSVCFYVVGRPTLACKRLQIIDWRGFYKKCSS